MAQESTLYFKDMEIIASREALVDQSGKVEQRTTSMKEKFERIYNIVNSSEGYWEGRASQAHREVYQSYLESIDEILKRFQENAENLKKIAQNYAYMERRIEEYTQDLPDSIIF